MAMSFFLFLFASFWVSGLQLNQTDKVVVRAFTGQNVMLECSSGNTKMTDSIGVCWNKTDLEQQKYVLFHKNDQSDITHQDPRFKDRVALAHPDFKNNNLSLILQNVSVNDSGEFECRLIKAPEMFNVAPIQRIQLIVIEPEMLKNHGSDNKNLGVMYYLLIAAVVSGAFLHSPF
ncbi:uncharacterized protein LOC129409693 [Boleophthalmus pectinirostris]|uniref:uncharacterized protein LOC129409693 n=1 Tax=Boleophthalmus pectinirostris TaxID=150288 RepID=UPI00242B2C74|nr:uncharacterized protein LOC129409693 [Boleophthalmus pectinirostris]